MGVEYRKMDVQSTEAVVYLKPVLERTLLLTAYTVRHIRGINFCMLQCVTLNDL